VTGAPETWDRVTIGGLTLPPPRVRLMRGQVVVRELDAPASARLWTPAPGARQTTTHRGIVLGIGPHPAPGASHGFEVGDVVQYHFGAVGTAKARTRSWTDGEPATWLTWEEVDAVWECGNVCPDGPYEGVSCSLAPHVSGVEHEAYTPRGDLLETWRAPALHDL
jgi:hypothetical protein